MDLKEDFDLLEEWEKIHITILAVYVLDMLKKEGLVGNEKKTREEK